MEAKRRLYEAHAELCKAISHPKRLEILDYIRDGERSVEEIAESTGMRKSNLSQHLAVLRKVQLVRTRRQGLHIFYEIAHPQIMDVCDTLRDILLDSWAESGALASMMQGEKNADH